LLLGSFDLCRSRRGSLSRRAPGRVRLSTFTFRRSAFRARLATLTSGGPRSPASLPFGFDSGDGDRWARALRPLLLAITGVYAPCDAFHARARRGSRSSLDGSASRAHLAASGSVLALRRSRRGPPSAHSPRARDTCSRFSGTTGDHLSAIAVGDDVTAFRRFSVGRRLRSAFASRVG